MTHEKVCATKKMTGAHCDCMTSAPWYSLHAGYCYVVKGKDVSTLMHHDWSSVGCDGCTCFGAPKLTPKLVWSMGYHVLHVVQFRPCPLCGTQPAQDCGWPHCYQTHTDAGENVTLTGGSTADAKDFWGSDKPIEVSHSLYLLGITQPGKHLTEHLSQATTAPGTADKGCEGLAPEGGDPHHQHAILKGEVEMPDKVTHNVEEFVGQIGDKHRTGMVLRMTPTQWHDKEVKERVAKLVNSINRPETIKVDVFTAVSDNPMDDDVTIFRGAASFDAPFAFKGSLENFVEHSGYVLVNQVHVQKPVN